MLTSFFSKHKMLIGLTALITLPLLTGGIVVADVLYQTSPSQNITATIPVSYQDVLNSPSDGNNGYLVDLMPFPANARITSADMYLKKSFTNTGDPSGQPVDPFGTVYLVPSSSSNPNTGPSFNIAQGDLFYGAGGFILQPSFSTTSDGIQPVNGELVLDIVNGANNGSSLSYLSAGKLKIYVNYTQYPAP